MCQAGKKSISTHACPHLFLLERNNPEFILVSTLHLILLAVLFTTHSDGFYFPFLGVSSFAVPSDAVLMYMPASSLSHYSLPSIPTTAFC